MICKRVNDDDCVLARFDHFVEIADRAVTNSGSQGAVVPNSLLTFEQETPDQIRGRQIFVAGDRDQRPLEPPGHVFDKARLAATSRAFEYDRQVRGMRRFEKIYFPANRQVVRLFSDSIFFNS